MATQEGTRCETRVVTRPSRGGADDGVGPLPARNAGLDGTTVTEPTLLPLHHHLPEPEQIWEQTFPGTTEQVRHVRAALRPLLRDCPVADDVVLLVSELSANAITHSASGKPGGKFTVRLQHFRGEYVWGEVEDDGSG